MSEYIVPDEFHKVNMVQPDGETDSYPVNAKYDRIDYFPRIGAFIIKLFDDEAGLVSFYVGEEAAHKLADEAELPIVERTFMFQSEHEGYLKAQSQLLTDEMFGGFDEVIDE